MNCYENTKYNVFATARSGVSIQAMPIFTRSEKETGGMPKEDATMNWDQIVKTFESPTTTGAKVFWTILILILPVLGLIIWSGELFPLLKCGKDVLRWVRTGGLAVFAMAATTACMPPHQPPQVVETTPPKFSYNYTSDDGLIEANAV